MLFVLTHISVLHASLLALIQDLYSGFYNHMVHTRTLLWFLLRVIHTIELSNIQLAYTQGVHLSIIYQDRSDIYVKFDIFW